MPAQPRFSVYSSSAGSGKTYTLVREYILLAIQNPGYFRHILAITFTNKAANEMKQRILLYLKHLSDQKSYCDSAAVKHMLPALANESGLTEKEIEIRAAAVLSQILHHYDDFAVRTIDSFVTRIIRTFARDLHLPVDFEIELDTDLLIDHAFDQMMEKVGVDFQLTKILVEFTRSRIDNESNWKVDQLIKSSAKLLFSERSYPYIEKLRSVDPDAIVQAARKINQSLKDFENKLVSQAAEALQLIDDNGIDHAWFANGKTGIGGFFRKFINGKPEMPNNTLVNNIRDNKWYSASSTPLQKNAIDNVKDHLLSYYLNLLHLIETGMAEYNIFRLISTNLFQLGVLSAFEKEISGIRTETGTLHISEFNKRITEIVVSEPVPFVYERTGEKYFNYLVDEFQDTSELQWKNLLPLIGNSLAEGNHSLVVGDAKQAIYRFRNGSVDQFVSLPQLPANYDRRVFGDVEVAMQNSIEQRNLDKNHRSLPEIVAFNNEFFQFVANSTTGKILKIYSSLKQEAKSENNRKGFVQVEFLIDNDNEQYELATQVQVTELVNKLVADGYSLKDITILVRTRAEGSFLAETLISNGIQVISAEALLLSSSRKVNLVVAVLQWLADSSNKITQAQILNELIRCERLTKELVSLFTVNGKNSAYFAAILAEAGIALNPSYLLTLPLYDLAEEIIRAFKLNNGKFDIFLQFFLDFVSKISTKAGTHLTDLLDAWDEQQGKLSVVIPQGIDAVQVMTIHKAKGLEFPVVIWPFADNTSDSGRASFWIDFRNENLTEIPVALVNKNLILKESEYAELYKEESENELLDLVNLMYVACTRPAERLYIISRDSAVSKSNTVAGFLKSYIDSDLEKWLARGSVFSRGDVSPVHPAMEKVNLSDSFSTMPMISSPWQQRIRVAQKARSVPNSTEISSQQWGNLVHQALAEIESPNGLEKITLRIANENKLSTGDLEILRRKVLSVINHPEIGPFFNPDFVHLPEKEIITSGNEVFRPDRVVIDADTAVIMEFKTGQKSPTHRQQIETYASQLKQMGYTPIRKLLIYIDDEVEVIEI